MSIATRIAEIEARLPPRRRPTPAETQEFLAGLSCEALRKLELVLERQSGDRMTIAQAKAILAEDSIETMRSDLLDEIARHDR